MSRHQQTVIEYLQEENRILLEQLGGKPKRFTEAQRNRLARKAKLVGRRRLGKLATLVTPDTLRWFRVLVAKKWTFPRTNPLGRLSAAAMNSAECSTITTAKPRELPFSMVSRVFWYRLGVVVLAQPQAKVPAHLLTAQIAAQFDLSSREVHRDGLAK